MLSYFRIFFGRPRISRRCSIIPSGFVSFRALELPKNSHDDYLPLDFAGPGPYPMYILQTISKTGRYFNKSFPHCCAQYKYDPHTIIWASPSVPTKINTTTPVDTHPSSRRIPHSPHYTRHSRIMLFGVDVPGLICVAADTSRHDQQHRQNCVSRYISQLIDSRAGGT